MTHNKMQMDGKVRGKIKCQWRCGKYRPLFLSVSTAFALIQILCNFNNERLLIEYKEQTRLKTFPRSTFSL